MTDGVDATLVVIDTGILALLADTCEGAHTIAVYCALGLAENIGVTLETRGTRTWIRHWPTGLGTMQMPQGPR